VLRALQGEQVNFASMPGTANERGTGLGLLLVREFLQKSNGTLTVYSQPGQGSTFTISLPVQHS
jgi:signal transduction histidine kinase